MIFHICETLFSIFSYLCSENMNNRLNDIYMRHRIKSGKVGSFTPEKQKVEVEQLEDREVADEVEEIFEEDFDILKRNELRAAVGY